MVKCPFCQYDNEEGALFCEQCKSDLAGVEPVAMAHPHEAHTGGDALPGLGDDPFAFGQVAEAEPYIEEAEPVEASPFAEAEPVEAEPIAAADYAEVEEVSPQDAEALAGDVFGAVPEAAPVAEPFSPAEEEIPEAAPLAAAPWSPAPTPPPMAAPPPAPPPMAAPLAAAAMAQPAAPAADAGKLPEGAQPRLVVMRGLKVNVEYPIYEGLNFVGRADEKPVDVDLEDQEPADRIWSSRQHAVIAYEEGKLFIEDLNSSNGTFVNRTRVHPGQRRELRLNDVIQIGTVQMKVKA